MQNKNEGQIFERIEVNWKFGRLISAIIEKSWPSEMDHHDEGTLLRHLLSWSAAKNIFQLYGKCGCLCELQENQANIVQLQCHSFISATDKKLFEKLSEDAKSKINLAVSTLVDINNDLANGNILISLLKVILEKREAYLDLLKIGNSGRRTRNLAAGGLHQKSVFVNSHLQSASVGMNATGTMTR